MRKGIFVLCLIFWGNDTQATVIHSCAGGYSAMEDGHERMIIARNGRNIRSMKIDHVVDGGVFSFDNAVLAVFDLPNKVNVDAPQVRHLSVYLIG
jgi:hypothetical protein